MKQTDRKFRPSNSSRIGTLSILPVFLDLKEKRAIVVGNTAAALWKAELLAQAGAELRIICSGLNAEVLQFVSDLPASRAPQLSVESWQKSDLSGAHVIVADVGSDEAASLFEAALRHTSMVNIIDKPEFCTFQFGSIVNRSPLVIGISTTGAAPVLAQYVRSLVEAVLPDGIQALAARAMRIRSRINCRLEPGRAKREYWTAFFGKAFRQDRVSRNGSRLPYMIVKRRFCDLTLRDVQALQSADVIYYDHSADCRISALGRREASRFEVPTGELERLSRQQSSASMTLVRGFGTTAA